MSGDQFLQTVVYIKIIYDNIGHITNRITITGLKYLFCDNIQPGLMSTRALVIIIGFQKSLKSTLTLANASRPGLIYTKPVLIYETLSHNLPGKSLWSILIVLIKGITMELTTARPHRDVDR